MKCSPTSNNKKEKILTLSMAIAAVVLYVSTAFVQRFVVLYQLSALILAVLSVELYLKYVFSNYIYEATESSLDIYKISGKKSICVASLSYEMSMTQIVSSEVYLNNKSDYPKTNFNVNYCKNLSPSEYYVYFFQFNGKNSMLKFEPDKQFAEYVNNLIAEAVTDEDEIY